MRPLIEVHFIQFCGVIFCFLIYRGKCSYFKDSTHKAQTDFSERSTIVAAISDILKAPLTRHELTWRFQSAVLLSRRSAIFLWAIHGATVQFPLSLYSVMNRFKSPFRISLSMRMWPATNIRTIVSDRLSYDWVCKIA